MSSNIAIDNQALTLSLLAGTIIQTAVSLKNSGEQYSKIPLKSLSGLPAKIMFAMGWLIFAHSICKESPFSSLKCAAAYGGAIAVILAVFHIKQSMKAGKKPNTLLKMLFPLGWLAIAIAIYRNGGALKHFGFVGAAMVLLSMMVVLPYQRNHNIIDGPGMNLFALAWIVLALGNAVKSIN